MQESDLEIEEVQFRSYSFTLRKTKVNKSNPVSEQDYFNHIYELTEKTGSTMSNYVFEKTGGLHMHGVLEIPINTYMLKFRVRGWKMHLKEIWNYAGWQQYMAKEVLIYDNESIGVKLQRSLFKDNKAGPPLQ